jgi:hypothetical protein
MIMSTNSLNWITIHMGHSDGVLRDLYARGKYRDVILLHDGLYVGWLQNSIGCCIQQS